MATKTLEHRIENSKRPAKRSLGFRRRRPRIPTSSKPAPRAFVESGKGLLERARELRSDRRMRPIALRRLVEEMGLRARAAASSKPLERDV